MLTIKISYLVDETGIDALSDHTDWARMRVLLSNQFSKNPEMFGKKEMMLKLTFNWWILGGGLYRCWNT